jgi:hypothetical protein
MHIIAKKRRHHVARSRGNECAPWSSFLARSAARPATRTVQAAGRLHSGLLRGRLATCRSNSLKAMRPLGRTDFGRKFIPRRPIPIRLLASRVALGFVQVGVQHKSCCQLPPLIFESPGLASVCRGALRPVCTRRCRRRGARLEGEGLEERPRRRKPLGAAARRRSRWVRPCEVKLPSTQQRPHVRRQAWRAKQRHGRSAPGRCP